MFSAFAPYDDEGYLLLTLRRYTEGAVLYDELFSLYGPAYHEIVRLLFRALGLGFTHVHGRTVVLVLWIASSVLCATAIYRLTRRVTIAVSVQLLVFGCLASLRNEPLHPAGLLCPLLAATMLLISFWGSRTAPLIAAGVGLFAALMSLMKLNVGGFVLASSVLVLLAPAAAGRARVPFLVAAGMVVSIPVVLTAGLWSEPSVRAYAWVVTCSTLAVVVSQAAGRQRFYEASLVAMLVSFAIAAVLLVVPVVARGTSLSALLHGVLLDPLRVPTMLFIPLEFWSPGVPAWALVSLVACLLLHSSRARRGNVAVTIVSGPAQLLAGGVMLAGPMAMDLPNYLGIALPMLWIPVAASSRDQPMARRDAVIPWLATLAVLQSLHAYPVAGSQIGWATFLLVPIGGMALNAGWDETIAWVRRSVTLARTSESAAIVAMISMLVLTITATRHIGELGSTYRSEYDQGIPLPVRGARTIRLSSSRARTYRWLVRQTSARCASMVTVPGFASLHLFTRLPPPVANYAYWAVLLSLERQQEMLDRFTVMPAPRCVVWDGRFLNRWVKDQAALDGPLIRHVRERFMTVESRGGYDLMMERDGPDPPLTRGGANLRPRIDSPLHRRKLRPSNRLGVTS